MTYSYDNRNRLIEEQRTAAGATPVEYHVSYAYDQVGNRLSKVDWIAGVETQYHYDVEEPETYHTLNNRLMYYEIFEDGLLAERVDYEYASFQFRRMGNVAHLLALAWAS